MVNDNNFQVGVVSTLVVTLLYWIFANLIKLAIKSVLRLRAFVAWKKSKILCVYENRDQAIKQMCEDVEKSNKIYFWGTTGVTFTGSESELKTYLYKKKDIRFLISSPSSKKFKTRSDELNRVGEFHTSSVSSFNELATSIDVFKEIKHIEYKLHDEETRFVICIFDKVLYLLFALKKEQPSSGEPEGINAKNSQVWRISEDSLLYKGYIQQFNDLWRNYKPPKGNEISG
jgi:hypothetical protein